MKKHILIIASLYIIAIALTVEFHRNCTSLRKLQCRQTQLLKAISGLRDRTGRLKKEMEALKKDPYFVERTAREQLGKIGAGEVAEHVENTPAISNYMSREDAAEKGAVRQQLERSNRMEPALWSVSRRKAPSDQNQ